MLGLARARPNLHFRIPCDLTNRRGPINSSKKILAGKPVHGSAQLVGAGREETVSARSSRRRGADRRPSPSTASPPWSSSTSQSTSACGASSGHRRHPLRMCCSPCRRTTANSSASRYGRAISKDERPPLVPLAPAAAIAGPSPTDLGFTRDRILGAQVGHGRLAMGRARARPPQGDGAKSSVPLKRRDFISLRRVISPPVHIRVC